MLNIIEISKEEFFKKNPKSIKEDVDSKIIYLVKNVIEKDIILNIRKDLEIWNTIESQRWMPLDINCVNFHRINDCYENSYVKTKTHTFYYNLWLKESMQLKDIFLDIFDFKRKVTDFKDLSYLMNTPKDGFVSRVVIHHYPIGGGFMEEHIDPINIYNPIQTIIQASQKGIDYKTGGLYVVDDESKEKIFVDDDFKIGDMIVFNPNNFHGVKSIDSLENIDWGLEKGRFLIIPLSLRSDYIKDNEESPKGVSFDLRTKNI